MPTQPSNAISIEENEIRSPSRTEKPVEKHKKDVKNVKKFVDSQITKEKTLAAGQETKAQQEGKESPESPMRATQFSRFGLGVMEQPSPEV